MAKKKKNLHRVSLKVGSNRCISFQIPSIDIGLLHIYWSQLLCSPIWADNKTVLQRLYTWSAIKLLCADCPVFFLWRGQHHLTKRHRYPWRCAPLGYPAQPLRSPSLLLIFQSTANEISAVCDQRRSGSDTYTQRRERKTEEKSAALWLSLTLCFRGNNVSCTQTRYGWFFRRIMIRMTSARAFFWDKLSKQTLFPPPHFSSTSWSDNRCGCRLATVTGSEPLLCVLPVPYLAVSKAPSSYHVKAASVYNVAVIKIITIT